MPENNVVIEVTAKTNTGMVREGNEDNFIVTHDYADKEWILPKTEFANPTTGAVMVVADGMGGLNAGEVASKIVVDSIREFFIKSVHDKANQKAVKQVLLDAILYAHEKIVAHGKKYPETAGMGSTVVVAWMIGNILHIGWAGDSRCYIWRNESLVQLSKDHSYVQTLVDKGEITTEQAFLHPEGNIVTQSLGDADRLPRPDYAAFSLNDNDVVLLCSDGLNGMLPDKEIDKIITLNTGDLPAAADLLIKEANAAGGNDNITVVMSKVISGAVPGPLLTDAAENGSEKTVVGKQRKKKQGKSLLYIGLAVVVLALAGFFVVPKLTGNRPKNDVLVVKDTSSGVVATQSAKPTKDSDGDGVPDDKDSCKNTPKDVKVDSKGCPIKVNSSAPDTIKRQHTTKNENGIVTPSKKEPKDRELKKGTSNGQSSEIDSLAKVLDASKENTRQKRLNQVKNPPDTAHHQ